MPQIESGGYYLAEARGYYRAHGLQVEILPGGPGLAVREVVGKGNADLGATDGNGVLVSVAAGLPLVIVTAVASTAPAAPHGRIHASKIGATSTPIS